MVSRALEKVSVYDSHAFGTLPPGISVNDEIMSKNNPLFVVNHRTNAM